ncbi:MAG TPA: hypothetical protein PL033_12130 [Candidatus Brocadiia bacterium]|nr:hypothetical protein [Candidatus Brocadiia bacterium]
MSYRHAAAALFASFALTASPAFCAEAIEIGSQLEPLVDDFLIERLDGLSLTLHYPVPHDVAIVHDAPWEGNTCCYHTIFKDGDIYRLYYRGSHYVPGKETHTEFACYAESGDGKTFTRPNLGIHEFNGSKDNSIIVAGGVHNFAPFKDANPACAADARYKALASGKGGLMAYKSPDGIHWSLMSDAPVITKGAFDSQNLAFWDTHRKRYVEFHRGFKDGFRDIMTGTSDDFLVWTDPVWLEYPGTQMEHLYTNQITQCPLAPHIFLGFPKRFTPDRNVDGHEHAGVSDGIFMTSRDGLNFNRWAEAFVRPGLQGERWVNRNNMTAWGVVTTKSDLQGAPDELSIYSTEGYYRGDASRLRRFSIRVNGFVSVQAPMKGGEMTTKPLVFSVGEKVALRINYSTSGAGSLRCEIQDADGKPIPGFSLTEADEIYGDSLDRTVTWGGRSEFGNLAGKPVRLRFAMKDADLYSVQFK